jgi:hypothetical protein
VPTAWQSRTRFSFFTQKYRFFGIEDAFYDKIQNAAYSYSESWHTCDSAGAVDKRMPHLPGQPIQKKHCQARAALRRAHREN